MHFKKGTLQHLEFHGCNSLTTLDLSGLTNVASVGDDFMCYCSDLKSLRLSGALLQHSAVPDKYKHLHAQGSAPAAPAAAA